MHMQNWIKFHRIIHKIMSGNEILTITNGHNSVVNLRKLTRNNPILDLLRSIHMQTLIIFHQFVHKILRGNETLTITKGNNHDVNLQKLTCNIPNIDLVDINASAKFVLIPSFFFFFFSQDIERKSEWRTSWKQYIPPPPYFVSGVGRGMIKF